MITEGYLKTMEQVISDIMEKYRLTQRIFQRWFTTGRTAGAMPFWQRHLGFDMAAQVQDPLV